MKRIDLSGFQSRPGPWARCGRAALALTLSVALVVQPFAANRAMAQQIIVDPSAPIAFRPSMGTSANGTPVINIAPPSFGGVSHNRFQRYDVDVRGVILNNSGLGGTSVIGGAVGANPNLAGRGPASVIVNQVTGPTVSVLNGPTEVFGQSAQVIIANPNGVTCVSCSFINASQVTLASAVPNPNYQMGTVSYAVTGGTVTIAGTGLAGPAGQPLGPITLIGRQLSIQAPVASSDTVRLVAGGGVYDAASRQMAALPEGTVLPPITGPAIQSSASGTIRAGTISVMSADVDLGVALTGQLTALSGPIAIRSAGDVALAGTRSAGDLTIGAGGLVTLAGRHETVGRMVVTGNSVAIEAGAELKADDAVIVEALGGLLARGTITSGAAVSLASGGTITASGQVTATGQLVLQARVLDAGNLTLRGSSVEIVAASAASLDAVGITATGGDVRLTAPAIGLGQGTTFGASGTLYVNATDQLINAAVLNYANLQLAVRNDLVNLATGTIAADALVLSVTGRIANAGTLQGRQSLRLGAARLVNEGFGTIVADDLTLTITDSIANAGTIRGGSAARIAAAELTNAATGTVVADNLALTVSDAIANAGSLWGMRSLSLAAARLTNQTSGVVAGPTVRIDLSGALDNSGAIAAGVRRDDGTLLPNGTLELTAASYVAGSPAALVAAANARLIVAGAFDNAGTVLGSNLLALQAGSITNRGSQAQIAGGALDVATTSGDIANGGAIVATAGMTVRSAGHVANAGVIAAAEGLGLTAGGAVVSAGRISAGGDLTLQAQSYVGTSLFSELGGRTLTVRLAGDFVNAGLAAATEAVTVNAAGLANLAGGALGGGSVTLTLTGDLANAGTIVSNGRLTIDSSGGLTANSGAIVAYGDAKLTFAGRIANAGAIQAGGDLVLAAAGYGGGAAAVVSAFNLSLAFTGDVANAGAIQALRQLRLSAANIAVGPEGFIVAGAAEIRATGNLTNDGGIGAASFLDLAVAGDLVNRRAIVSEGNALVTAGGRIDNAGTIAAAGILGLAAASLANAGTGAIGAQQIEIRSAGRLTNAGVINGTKSLIIRAADLTNAGAADLPAVISSDDLAVALTGALVNGPNAVLQGGASVRIVAASLNQGFFENQTVAAGQFNHGGDVAIQLTASGYTFNAPLVVKGNLTFDASGDIVNNAIIAAYGTLSLTSGGSIRNGDPNNRSTVYANNIMDVRPKDDRVGLILAGSDMVIAARGDITNANVIRSNGSIALQAGGSIVNLGTGTMRPGFYIRNVGDTSYDGNTGCTAAVCEVVRANDPRATGVPRNPVFDDANPIIVGTVTREEAIALWAPFAPAIPGGGSMPVDHQNTYLTILTDSAVIAAAGNVTLTAGARVENRASAIASGGSLTITAPTVANVAGTPLVLVNPITGETVAETPGSWTAAYPDPYMARRDALLYAASGILINGGTVTNSGTMVAGDIGLPAAGAGLVAVVGPLRPALGPRSTVTALVGAVGTGAPLPATADIFLSAGAGIGPLGPLQGPTNAIGLIGLPLRAPDWLMNAGRDARANVPNFGASAAEAAALAPNLAEASRVIPDYANPASLSPFAAGARGAGSILVTGDTIVSSGRIIASGDVTLIARGSLAVVPRLTETTRVVTEGGKITTTTTRTNEGAELTAGGVLTLIAGGDMVIQASRLTGGTINLITPASLILAAAVDETQVSVTGTSTGLFTQTVYDHGSVTQSLVYNQIRAGSGGLNVSAGAILIDYLATTQAATLSKAHEVQITGSSSQTPSEALASLAGRPGLEWMAQLAGDPGQNVGYNGLTITNITWNHDQTTLSPAASALISVIASVVVPGIGSALGTALGMTTSLSAAIGGALGIGEGLVTSALASAVTASASSLVAGSAIGLINGNFNLGQILQNAALAGLTAGLTAGLSGVLSGPGGLIGGDTITQVLREGGGLGAITGKTVINSITEVTLLAATRAGLRSLITGSDFGESFVSELARGAASGIVSPVLMNAVGDLNLPAGSPVNALLHAGVGGLSGYIIGGPSGAAGGALGAALGELALGVDPSLQNPANQAFAMGLSQILGGLGSFAAGDASMAGADAALAGYLFNLLLHCGSTSPTGCAAAGIPAGVAAAAAAAGACVLTTAGTCAPVTPGMLVAGGLAGAGGGLFADLAIGLANWWYGGRGGATLPNTEDGSGSSTPGIGHNNPPEPIDGGQPSTPPNPPPGSGPAVVVGGIATGSGTGASSQIPGPAIDYDTVSTAGPEQATQPRDLSEQILWNLVRADPAAGRPMIGLNNDPRFLTENGWQKMEIRHERPDGTSVVIHYQYNSLTNRAYDIKFTTPLR